MRHAVRVAALRTPMLFAAMASAFLSVSPAWAAFDAGRFYVGTMCVPANCQTEAHIQDMRECGIDFVIGLRGTNAYDLCQKYGIDVIEHRLYPANRSWWNLVKDEEKWNEYLRDHKDDYIADVDKLAKTCKRHPVVKMTSLGDEPGALLFERLGKYAAEINRRFPEAPTFLNLMPNYGTLADIPENVRKSQIGTTTYYDYIDQYCRKVPTEGVSLDFYPIPPRKSRNRWFEERFLDNCQVVSDACLRYGRTFWFMPQVNVRPGTDFDVTANMLRYQAYVAMAYGAERLCWACWIGRVYGGGWWDRNVLDDNGEKSPRYYILKDVNAEVHRLATTFMRYREVNTILVGDCDGDGRLAKRGVRRADSYDDGYVTSLRAADNSPLAVGLRVGRDTASQRERAYFIVPIGDPVDEKRGVREIVFNAAGTVSVVGPDGAIPFVRGDDGKLRFSLVDNHAAMILLTP